MLQGLFDRFSARMVHLAGTSRAFVAATLVVVVWAVSGPFFQFSDSWQLSINTGTTIVTFLMVFAIQHTQNKDGLAMQIKLNELIAATQGASNRLVNAEDLDQRALASLHAHYAAMAKMTAEAKDLFAVHSIDESEKPSGQ
jgi:low affinity Fe/Cu permease